MSSTLNRSPSCLTIDTSSRVAPCSVICPTQFAQAGAATRTFYVRNYADRCLDFASPPKAVFIPVVIAPCRQTATQQVWVQEINNRHEVLLHAGDRVIGVHDPEPSTDGGNAPARVTEFALELQIRANPIDPAFRNQVFALDGDSIILAADRDLVVQVQDNRGATGVRRARRRPFRRRTLL